MMKKVIVGLLLSAGISSLSAGIVEFANFGGGVNAPIFLPDGSLAGSSVTAELWMEEGGDFVPTSVSAMMRDNPSTGEGTGLFLGGTVALEGVTGGTFQIRFFEGDSYASSLNVGEVDLGELTLPEAPAPPLILTGLNDVAEGPAGPGTRTMYVIPEPSTIGLAILGAGLLFFRRRK